MVVNDRPNQFGLVTICEANMHPLVVAIRRLDEKARLDIDRFLLVNGMYIRGECGELNRLKKCGVQPTGLDGMKVFLILEKTKRASRKFRKLSRKLMSHHPMGTRAPANDPSWELAAYQLLVMARREQKRRKRKVQSEIQSW